MSDLVGNPEDRFSRVEAQMVLEKVIAVKQKIIHVYKQVVSFSNTIVSINTRACRN